MELEEAKRQFINAWGNLGSSWGINKVMGQIHALLLVSPQPLSTDDIMEELQISRGNANMNIRGLLDWGIIYKESLPGERKEFFRAEKDILTLARQVSRERKRREIDPIINILQQVQDVQSDDKVTLKEFKGMTKEIQSFSENMNAALDKFIKSDSNWFYRKLMRLFI